VRTKVFVVLPRQAPPIHVDAMRAEPAPAAGSARQDDVAAILAGV
jgi:hypothetical protein